MLFRFWLFTSVIVAFVAFCGAFGIQLTPSSGDASYSSRLAGPTVLDDDFGRGR